MLMLTHTYTQIHMLTRMHMQGQSSQIGMWVLCVMYILTYIHTYTHTITHADTHAHAGPVFPEREALGRGS